jgi:hypothetical protein
MNKSYRRISKILSRSFGTKFFSLILITAVISGCNESSVVGLDVQPQEDLLNLGWIDTTTVICKTVKEDSVRTDNLLISSEAALIGKYMDPIFGTAVSSLYTQLRLPSNNPDFGTDPVCDSIVFTLAYSPKYYGKRGRVSQNINIHQLSESLSGTTYYSNNSIAYNSTDLAGNYGFIPRPNDSVLVNGKKVTPHVRIPLLASFGQSILDKKGLAELASNTAFQDFTKGLYITTENTVLTSGSGDGNILTFKMSDPQTKITIFYHYTNQTVTDYKSYDLTLNNVTRFLKYNHDITNADPYFKSQLAGTSTVDTSVFLQGMAGSKVKIDFPHLKHINDLGKVAINKAELVIKVDKNPLYQVDTFTVPGSLSVIGIDANGALYFLPDAYESHQLINGSFNGVETYTFNIDRYIQQVLNGSLSNTGLYLYIPGYTAGSGVINPNRVVIGSGNNSGSQKMKLNLTYTKLH